MPSFFILEKRVVSFSPKCFATPESPLTLTVGAYQFYQLLLALNINLQINLVTDIIPLKYTLVCSKYYLHCNPVLLPHCRPEFV